MAAIVYIIGLLSVLAIAGLALDLGSAYVARSRLQNALDAAAISGAYSLNRGLSTTQATTDALATFNQNKGGLPASTPTPTVEFSPTLSPFSPGLLNTKYVRVTMTAMPNPVMLAVVLPGVSSTLNIHGRAVAGPIPLGHICNAMPVAVCGNNSDTDCSDGSCYGLGSGELQIKGDSHSLGPGNYGLVQLGCAGAACVRENMAGGGDFCFDTAGKVKTEPGVSSGPTAQGLNTRFGVYSGPVSASDYPPDVVTTQLITYSAYQALTAAGTWDHPEGKPQRRVPVAPVISCTPPINGSKDASVLGAVCLFLTRLADSTSGTIYAQIAPTCVASGDIPDDPGVGGAVKIVLYQDAG